MKESIISDKLQKLIAEREKIEGEIDYKSNPIIKGMVDLLSEDVTETAAFLDKECSEAQLIWMSEIFDEVAERTKSKVFIDSLRRAVGKYPEAAKNTTWSFLSTAQKNIQNRIS